MGDMKREKKIHYPYWESNPDLKSEIYHKLGNNSVPDVNPTFR
jgi:hypothetical protein